LTVSWSLPTVFQRHFGRNIHIKEQIDEADFDVYFFAGGIASYLEGEEGLITIEGFSKRDRTNIEVPDFEDYDMAVPKYALRGFDKVFVPAGKSVKAKSPLNE